MIFTSTRFAPVPVELAVEDLLPRAEVELALGDRHHDLAAHDLPLVVGVGVVLARAVVVVALRRRIERGQFFEPLARSPRCRPGSSSLMNTLAVMCIALTKQQALADAALANDLFDLRRDVHEVHPGRHVERQVFGVRFHARILAQALEGGGT